MPGRTTCGLVALAFLIGWVIAGCVSGGSETRNDPSRTVDAATAETQAASPPSTPYMLRPGDLLLIRLPDFVAQGVVSEFRPVVDAGGDIELPQLGRIPAAGRTAAQVRDAIMERAPYALVYPIDAVPTPHVELLPAPDRR